MRKILIANKADMPEREKKIDSARGQALADQHGLTFYETSAKTGLNVSSVFEHIAREIIKDFQAQGIETNNTRAMGGNQNYQNRMNTPGYNGDPQDLTTI